MGGIARSDDERGTKHRCAIAIDRRKRSLACGFVGTVTFVCDFLLASGKILREWRAFIRMRWKWIGVDVECRNEDILPNGGLEKFGTRSCDAWHIRTGVDHRVPSASGANRGRERFESRCDLRVSIAMNLFDPLIPEEPRIRLATIEKRDRPAMRTGAFDECGSEKRSATEYEQIHAVIVCASE